MLFTAKILGFQFMLAFITWTLVSPAAGHHLLETHKLTCSEEFPCPEAIKPRVQFWISVFNKWDKHTAILHDSQNPQRVFAVIQNKRGCDGRSAAIKRARASVKKNLRSVAKKISAQQQLTNANDIHYGELFIGAAAARAQEMRNATRRIRCQRGVKDSFVAGLNRFDKYKNMVDGILTKHNLPAEIRYLPFVESSYNPAAYSKAGAAGMWQIMPRTARVLGLKLNASVDERLDPVAATAAAAKYLNRARRDLRAVAIKKKPGIKSAELNPFIITSYNYGVAGMKRAMARVGVDYMQVLERHKSSRFRVAVKNFYASFLAVIYVGERADEYFSDRKKSTPQKLHTVVIKKPVEISNIKKIFALNEKQLRPLNRSLTKNVWRGWRFVPAGYRLKLPATRNWEKQINELAALPSAKLAGGGDYIVRRGDTACGIARAVRVNCSKLIAANNLGRRALIYPGQKLVIPGRTTTSTGGTPKAVATLNVDNQYIVRRGDSPCLIAKKFNVNCVALVKLNSLTAKTIIHPGQKLSIPGKVVPPTSDTAIELAQLKNLNLKKNKKDSATATQTYVADAGAVDNLRNLLDTLPPLGITVASKSGVAVYRARVEADETLGHFADWLGLSSTRKLRALNNIRSQQIKIGRWLELPIEDADVVVEFERKREDYHQVLSEALKEHYDLVGIENYQVKSGDSAWLLARQFDFPQWLLYRLNPVLHQQPNLKKGQELVVPKLRNKG